MIFDPLYLLLSLPEPAQELAVWGLYALLAAAGLMLAISFNRSR